MKAKFYVTAKDSYYRSVRYVTPVRADTKEDARSIFMDMSENRHLIPVHVETASELATRQKHETDLRNKAGDIGDGFGLTADQILAIYEAMQS